MGIIQFEHDENGWIVCDLMMHLRKFIDEGWVVCDTIEKLEESVTKTKSILFNYIDSQYPNAECLRKYISKHWANKDREYYISSQYTKKNPVFLAMQDLNTTKLSAFIDLAFPTYSGDKSLETRQDSCIMAVNELVNKDRNIAAISTIIGGINYLYQIPVKTKQLDQTEMQDYEAILLHWQMALNPERLKELELNINKISVNNNKLRTELSEEINNIYKLLNKISVKPTDKCPAYVHVKKPVI